MAVAQARLVTRAATRASTKAVAQADSSSPKLGSPLHSFPFPNFLFSHAFAAPRPPSADDTMFGFSFIALAFALVPSGALAVTFTGTNDWDSPCTSGTCRHFAGDGQRRAFSSFSVVCFTYLRSQIVVADDARCTDRSCRRAQRYHHRSRLAH